MPLAVKERVELPKGVVRARKGDNIYIQYIVRVYRNEKGKPTNDRVCIGKLDQETGKLIQMQDIMRYLKNVSRWECRNMCGAAEVMLFLKVLQSS